MCIKIANSTWSKGFDISSVGTINTLAITDSYLRDLEELGKPNIRSFQVSAYTTAAPDKFWRTKIVTFYPRFMLVNNINTTILYRQVGTSGANHPLRADDYVPYHWTNKGLFLLLDSFSKLF